MNRKTILIILIVVISIGFLAWLFIESSKPLPGEKDLQDGRGHLPEGSNLEYKFNPPTSGDHYPSWITKGFYDTPRADGNLVHSMEHGYIIVWYDCEKKLTMDNGQWTKEAFSILNSQFSIIAHAQEPAVIATNSAQGAVQNIQMTSGSEGSASATLADLPKAFTGGSCDNLKSKLKEVYNKFGPHKLVVVPRVGMDHPVILTAWGRMEKLNSVDQGKIKEFIDGFRDAGPEATNEP